jgi:hypothetical protein
LDELQRSRKEEQRSNKLEDADRLRNKERHLKEEIERDLEARRNISRVRDIEVSRKILEQEAIL